MCDHVEDANQMTVREQFEKFAITAHQGGDLDLNCQSCGFKIIAIANTTIKITDLLDECMTHLMSCQGKAN